MVRIKVLGLGGQGVVSAVKILAHAVGMYEDKYASTFPSYGHERRGALVTTDAYISSEPILINAFVYRPDLLLVLDKNVFNIQKDLINLLNPQLTMVINQTNQGMDGISRNRYDSLYYVDATAISLSILRKNIPNMCMLGALAKAGIVQIDSLVKTVAEFFGTTAELNIEAVRKGYEETRNV